MRSLHVRYLVARPRKGGTSYYWSPTRKLIAAGFAIRRLSNQMPEAVVQAEQLNAQLDAWYRGEGKTGPRVPADSLQALYELFQRDDGFRKLSPRSQRDLIANMKLALEWAGDLPVRGITRKVVKAWFRSLRDERGPSVTRNVAAALRRVLSFGVDEQWIAVNPCLKLGLATPPSRERVWTLAERDTFLAAAFAAQRPSMALAVVLGWWLGQRPADLRTLSWADYDGEAVSVKQAKTETRIWVPAHPELRSVLNVTPRTDKPQIVISETTGEPYNASPFEHLFAEIREAAGLPKDLQFRDLRRTLATALGAAGCTDDQIRAITGHKTRAVVAVYVRPDRTFAEGAMKRLQQAGKAKSRTRIEKRSTEPGGGKG